MSAINLVVTIASFFAFATVLLLEEMPGYEYYFLHPVFFLVCYHLAFKYFIKSGVARPFFLVFSLIGFLRFVILPVLVVISGYYAGRSHVEPASSSYSTAILLMLWEISVCSIIIFYFKKREIVIGRLSQEREKIIFYDTRRHAFYILFALGVILLAVANPTGLATISFLAPRDADLDVSAISSFDNLVAYSIIVAKTLLFIILLKFCAKKYRSSRSRFYLYLAFAGAFFNISIYWGTNRSDILIAAFASFLVLYDIFGRQVLRISLFGCAVLFFLLSAVTEKRDTITVTRGENALVDVADVFQAYTGGVYNVALAIETKDFFPEVSDRRVLLMDIFRPVIGINFLLKDVPQVYSNVFFNMRVWTHVERRSQILPMIGQGNIHFGYFFAPVFAICFLFFARFLEAKNAKGNDLEVVYFFNLALIRLGFMMGQNTMNMLNDISMNLFLFFIVYFSAKLFYRLFLNRAA